MRKVHFVAVLISALGLSVGLVGCGPSETPTGAVVTDYPGAGSEPGAPGTQPEVAPRGKGPRTP
jgi:hypothetical protein